MTISRDGGRRSAARYAAASCNEAAARIGDWRLLDATLERSPLHFHVAVFPDEYLAYVSRLTGRSGDALLASVETPAPHTVRPSETLWGIAHRYGTTPARIRDANGLESSVIHPGQRLKIPGNS